MQTVSSLNNSVADFLSLYFRQEDLQQKNEELEKQLITAYKKNVALGILKEENEFLKQELEFIDEYEYKATIARVLGRSLNYENTDIIINKGYLDGLIVGLAVTTNQGIIIGKVIKTESNLSHVRLLINNNSKLAALVIGETTNSLGLAYGQHNLNLTIDMLPKDNLIQQDDLVVTADSNLNIPPGLLIGRISKIENRPEFLWQEALIEPLIDYNSIRLVTVILPANN